jgi:hypothetical protein
VICVACMAVMSTRHERPAAGRAAGCNVASTVFTGMTSSVKQNEALLQHNGLRLCV